MVKGLTRHAEDRDTIQTSEQKLIVVVVYCDMPSADFQRSTSDWGYSAR